MNVMAATDTTPSEWKEGEEDMHMHTYTHTLSFPGTQLDWAPLSLLASHQTHLSPPAFPPTYFNGALYSTHTYIIHTNVEPSTLLAFRINAEPKICRR